MASPQYALVAYIHNDLGQFVAELRRELHPELGLLPAHMSILPPRPLCGSEQEALTILGRLCQNTAPFDVTMNGVESFLPVTPTVYIRVETPAPLVELHDRLNTQALAFREPWSYVPHLTIAKLTDEARLRAALELARERWSAYRGSREARIGNLTFVREGQSASHWVNLAALPLGGGPASDPRA